MYNYVSLWPLMIAHNVLGALGRLPNYIKSVIGILSLQFISTHRYHTQLAHRIVGSPGKYAWIIFHYCDVIMGTMASQITSLRLFTQPFIQAQIKENSKAPRYWPFVRGIHRWPVNSPHKGPVTRKMSPFDYVIMLQACIDFTCVDSSISIDGFWSREV